MRITRQISISFESEGCTEEELESAAEYKLREIQKIIGLSCIFPVRSDVQKKVIWHLQHGESITAINHKGKKCVYPDGHMTCQEGLCETCAIPMNKTGSLNNYDR